MKKPVLIIIVCLLAGFMSAGQSSVVNPKGTKIGIDTSKWRLSGSDIYTKNSGNVGIGITVPLYKLDISATANPLRLAGLQTGTSSDSILTVLNGVVRYASISRFITDTSIYKYDGTLTANRTLTQGGNTFTIATGGSAFNISGLTSGAATDSLLTINPATNRVYRIATSQLNRNDSTTASNGITLTGKDVRLGGNLSQATTVTSNSNALTFATGGTALNITGLPSGAATDSIVTVNSATGQLRNVTINKLITDTSIYKYDGTLTANRTLTQGGKTLTIATGGTALNITGLPGGAATDSVLTVENGTGALKKIPQLSSASIKTNTTQATSSTTPTTINTLSFTTVAGKNYRIRLWLVYNAAATTTGIQLSPVAFSGGNYWYTTMVNTSTTTPMQISGFNAVNLLTGTASRATTGNVAVIDMTVEATSAATVSFQFASEVNSSAITIQANSRLEYEIIN